MSNTTVRGDQNGPAIRAARKWRELSVLGLCLLLKEKEKLTVHPHHIRNVETNARGASPQLIGAIARVLDVPKEQILRDADQLKVSAALDGASR